MKIIGFAQLHNELEQGNLFNFVDSMRICDEVYVYDQASTDGSAEVYRAAGYTVYYSEINDHYNEVLCKDYLLRRILKEHPDADWIFWLDGDTILDKRLWDRQTFEAMLSIPEKYDHIMPFHYNLWRSDTYFRTDNKFHCLNQNVAAFWRVRSTLSFGDDMGLHVRNCPLQLRSRSTTEYALIHRGFATDENLIKRFRRNYNRYVEHGESPWITMRSIDETTLKTVRIPNASEILPLSVQSRDVDPLSLEALTSVYCYEIEAILGMGVKEAMARQGLWML